MPPLLTVENLRVQFPHPDKVVSVVDGVSFTLGPARTLALVGESGCGKTMTALAMLRLLPAQAVCRADTLRLGDRDLLPLTARKMTEVRGRDVGMIFQEPLTAFNPLYPVGEQTAEVLRRHEGLRRREANDRVIDLFREVGLPGPERLARSYPHQLSGGQRQRAMIAMALACRPRLLIADEPTTALDVSMQAQIIDLLLRLQAERGIAILLITHDLGVVAELAHDVAVLYAGQVVEKAECRALFARPSHPYTLALLASLPRMPRPGETPPPLATIPGVVPEPSRFPTGCRFGPRCERFLAACMAPQAAELLAPGHEVRCGRAREGVA